MTRPDATDPSHTGAASLETHDRLAAPFPPGLEGRVLLGLAIAFSLFQIATAAHVVDLPSQIVRAVHVGFLTLLAFPLVASTLRWTAPARALSWLVGAAGFAVGLYQWIEYKELILRSGDLTETDVVVGIASIAILLVATWIALGPSLPILASVFLLYCLLGNHLPAPLDHRGYDIAQVIDHMAFGTEGIYGIPTYVSSTYIFLFILFGAFLERAGMINLFTDVSMGLVGHTRGGPAKVSVVSSAMMGTISGSGVANVVTTGQFTIPLMKRFGYRPAFAGGVEATASMGGQIMPPVMGAVAFIMAETLDIPYAKVVEAAVIPALLYFASAFWMVHLEAGKRGLLGLPIDDLPSALGAIRRGWHLLLPLAALVYLLFAGYTPLYAGTVGLALTALLILGTSVALGIPPFWLRVLFWIGLGIVGAAFFKYGLGLVGAAIGLLIAVNLMTRGGRETVWSAIQGLAEGAKAAIPVGIACAVVGIVVGTMTLTGAATNFGRFVVSVGESSLILSLVLTMLTSIVLGMGIPTIPNYIITSSLAGPALLELGVPLIVGHMFVFYFGILADLTPPVALACFAAAPIARESGLKISFQAVKIAAAGFVVPYMAVYSPALMLQDGGPLSAAIGYPLAVAYIVTKAVLAMALWGAAVIGFLRSHMNWPERILAAAAAASLIVALPLTDEIGFALALVVLLWHWRRLRARTVAP
ncbi:MAG: TRAP transporter permease [Pseudomonadota bacterium]